MIPLFSLLTENLENLQFSTTIGLVLTSDNLKLNEKKFDFLTLLGGWMRNSPKIFWLLLVIRAVSGAH